MRIRKLVRLMLILFLSFTFLSLSPVDFPFKISKVEGSPDWFYPDFTYRKEHKITGSSAGTVTNYPMLFEIHWDTGVSLEETTVSIPYETYSIQGHVVEYGGTKMLFGGGFWRSSGEVDSGGVFLWNPDTNTVEAHWIPDYDGVPHANSNHVVLLSQDKTIGYVFGHHWQDTVKIPLIAQVFNLTTMTRIGQEYHPDTDDSDEAQAGIIDYEYNRIFFSTRPLNPNRVGYGGGGIWYMSMDVASVLDYTTWSYMAPTDLWGVHHTAQDIVKLGGYYYFMIGILFSMEPESPDDKHALWRVPVTDPFNPASYELIWQVKRGTSYSRSLGCTILNNKLYYPKLDLVSLKWQLKEWDGTQETHICDIVDDPSSDFLMTVDALPPDDLILTFTRTDDHIMKVYIVNVPSKRIAFKLDNPIKGAQPHPAWPRTFADYDGKHIVVRWDGTNYYETILQLSDREGLVDLEGHGQADFDDVRFTWYNPASGEEQAISYWIETLEESNYAIFWVEIPKISNVADNIVYLYYGNSTVTTTSNILS